MVDVSSYKFQSYDYHYLIKILHVYPCINVELKVNKLLLYCFESSILKAQMNQSCVKDPVIVTITLLCIQNLFVCPYLNVDLYDRDLAEKITKNANIGN